MITHRSVTTMLVTILWMASVRGPSAQLLPANGQSPQGAIRILPVKVSEHMVSLPSFIHSAVPGLSRVGVEVVVAPTGVVVSAMPASGSQQWYEKAAALVMTWRFTPFEREGKAAVEDGVAAFENLLSKLTDVPTPSGQTPRQIGSELAQITSVRPALPSRSDESILS